MHLERHAVKHRIAAGALFAFLAAASGCQSRDTLLPSPLLYIVSTPAGTGRQHGVAPNSAVTPTPVAEGLFSLHIDPSSLRGSQQRGADWCWAACIEGIHRSLAVRHGDAVPDHLTQEFLVTQLERNGPQRAANIREILKALCPQLAHRYESEKYNNELDDAIHDLLGSHSDWAVSSDELIMSIADGFPMIVGLLHEGQTDGHACLVIGVTFRQLDPNEQRRFSSHRRRLIDRHAPRYGAQAFLPMWGIAEVTIWDPAHASTRRLFGSDFSAQTAFLLGLNEACQLMELELDSRARSRERAKLLPKSSARPQQIEGLRIEMKPTNRR